MASGSAQSPVEKPGITIDTTATPLSLKASQDTLTQPFPTLEEKETRRSDISTPATTRANPFDTDIEAMPVISHQRSSRQSPECTKGGTDCHAWPGRDHWKRKAKAAKKSRHSSCNCLAGLSKRNRIIVRILIIVLIVAIAVGVGFGISKPLGAGIWRSETQNK
ncbi:hypothetical protein N657DRAFT_492065 [Parathielavia appendiculata]|uniref:Uncharacterized protein n=1 Tax=Parathielavia appendiculata TaxID=2587402 RepID=A0AAN6TWV8_9PEZI|nr:hypothetical protein N657DRAFT_492065 [Parathielavia appendiculata]